jgi:hypothetical protein
MLSKFNTFKRYHFKIYRECSARCNRGQGWAQKICPEKLYYRFFKGTPSRALTTIELNLLVELTNHKFCKRQALYLYFKVTMNHKLGPQSYDLKATSCELRYKIRDTSCDKRDEIQATS